LLLPIGLVILTAVVNKLFPLVAIDAVLTKARKRALSYFWIALALAAVAVALRRFVWPNAA
jgi:hypothetical protein